MAYGYVEPRRARHRVVRVDGVERLRIPVRRQWFAIAFLPFWLCGWAFGEMDAAKWLVTDFNWFMAFWICGWTVGGFAALSMLLAQLGGAELVWVERGDLVVSAGVGPIRRTWRYRGDTICNLMGWYRDDAISGSNVRTLRPLWGRAQTGSVKFDYGAESIFLALGVDEPEGAVIAEWLGRRLPRSARGEDAS